MTDIRGVQIGTCDRCGRPILVGQRTELVKGLLEHVVCPLVSLYPGDLGGDAA